MRLFDPLLDGVLFRSRYNHDGECVARIARRYSAIDQNQFSPA
jgi:hypothetical protein